LGYGKSMGTSLFDKEVYCISDIVWRPPNILWTGSFEKSSKSKNCKAVLHTKENADKDVINGKTRIKKKKTKAKHFSKSIVSDQTLIKKGVLP